MQEPCSHPAKRSNFKRRSTRLARLEKSLKNQETRRGKNSAAKRTAQKRKIAQTKPISPFVFNTQPGRQTQFVPQQKQS
jgi:protein subunit release factor B